MSCLIHLKHRFCHRTHSSYRWDYSTTTVSPDPHLTLTQEPKHLHHLQAPHLAGAATTWVLLRSVWSQEGDGEAAVSPAAEAPAGFSLTPSGSGQLSPSKKQSLETTTKASAGLRPGLDLLTELGLSST